MSTQSVTPSVKCLSAQYRPVGIKAVIAALTANATYGATGPNMQWTSQTLLGKS